MHVTMPLPRFLRALVGGLLIASGAASAVGCARTATAAELERNGTHAYPHEKRAHVVKATQVALRTLGYEVVVADEASGRVKTAPKVVQVRAVGNGTYASAFEDALAWNIEVDEGVEGTDGVVVHAHPRPSRNGQPLADTDLTAAYMEKAFAQLFDEIEEDLHGTRDVTPATGRGTKSATGDSKDAGKRSAR